MDELSLHRNTKNIEKKILKRAREDGYQSVIRTFLREWLGADDLFATQEKTISLAHVLGVLHRAGYMTFQDIETIFKHIGALIE